MLPSKSKLFKNKSRNKDHRGEIKSIVDTKISNVSIIKCNANSIRSNHYHKRDFHFMYVLKGTINYFFSDLEMKDIKFMKIKPGDTIFTPKMEIHATHFPVDTTLIVSSLNPRDRETYEKDTRRVEFINHNNVDTLLSQSS